MKTIIIDIKRTDSDKELSEITAYTGSRGDGPDPMAAYDRVATADEDASLLSRYWMKGGSALAENLKDFLTDFRMDGESITLSLEVSGSYDDALTPSLKDSFRAFVVAVMATGWFGITCEGKASVWLSESDRIMGEARRKLYHRRRPVRRRREMQGDDGMATDIKYIQS